ncbi:3-isopropylmalate dehydratase large subunit [Ekhidna sp.]|uniref:3-isopropylmalate dehydratase large subunit n=1 Tax=Ekhidna sp. TaxID=2608089 RepID=UPI003298F74E
MMGKTLFDKIWKRHVVKNVSKGLDVLFIDQHFLHEVTSPQAFDGLRVRGIEVLMPHRCLATADHNVPTVNQSHPIKDPLSAVQVASLKANCEEFRIDLFGIGHENQGIVHIIGPDLGITQPGMTIVCGDSHTSTHGAFGTIAFGIGTSQVEQVLATQSLVLSKPKTMKIEVNGTLPQGATSKDVILYIISKLGTEGATGHFVEYCGSVFEKMSMEERMTVCNMSIEMGARGGLIGVDQTTIDYVCDRKDISQKKISFWKTLNTDVDAEFDKSVAYKAENIFPMVTTGTAPDTGIRLNERIGAAPHLSEKSLQYMQFDSNDQVSDQVVDYVFIGSCTNGRIEDLRAVASLIKGRKKADKVNAWVVPGSMKVRAQAIEENLDQIFRESGFEFREPGCSACLAMNDDKIPSGSLCVSTSNRNFEGRQGEGARTVLASPLTAAASALTGKITDPTVFLDEN